MVILKNWKSNSIFNAIDRERRDGGGRERHTHTYTEKTMGEKGELENVEGENIFFYNEIEFFFNL